MRASVETNNGRTGHEVLNVAIIGSGNIGTDLLMKTMRAPLLNCALFVGRSPDSRGLRVGRELGVPVSHHGLEGLLEAADDIDLVFDATSAADAVRHWSSFRELGLPVIDLTPAKLGQMCVPALNLEQCRNAANLSLVTCGGQAAVPIAAAITSVQPCEYCEIVTTSASRSVGPATRRNLDEYIATTEAAVIEFARVERSKAITVVNPAEPCIIMQSTILVRVDSGVDLDQIELAVARMAERLQSYVPGYEVAVPPTVDGEKLVVTVRVEGAGDFLPEYAGNLDVITCAAIAAAESRVAVAA
jgi:acetaldehyde/propanal dehydrogenase